MYLDLTTAEIALMARARVAAEEFDCGACRRAQTCGLPPSHECEERLLQWTMVRSERSAGGRAVPAEVHP